MTHFVENKLPALLEEVPLGIRRFMDEGGPPHVVI